MSDRSTKERKKSYQDKTKTKNKNKNKNISRTKFILRKERVFVGFWVGKDVVKIFLVM